MARAYYNEFDPRAAAWLRILIAEGLIAEGDVDERSIVDVQPGDLAGYTQCHFFAGIGVWSYALRRAGWPDDAVVWTGSCPCQPFSDAGAGRGLEDERHLWPELFRLVAERRPPVLFGEQVASKDGLHWLDLVSADLEGAGYAFGAADTCAAGVGAPHIRQRLYFVAHASGDRAWKFPRVLPRHEGEHGLGAPLEHNAPQPGGAAGELAQPGDLGLRERSAPRLHGDREGRHHPDRCGQAGALADDRSGGPRPLERGPGGPSAPEGGRADAERCGSAHDRAVVHTEREGLEGHAGDGHDRNEPGRLRADEARPATEAGGARSLADPERLGREVEVLDPRGGGPPGGQREAGVPRVCGASGGRLADPDGGDAGEGGEQRGGEHRLEPQDGGAVRGGPRRLRDGPTFRLDAGATHGFWGDADWLRCRDGRWRPVEPGTFPLAHGVAERVGRLRGYGNGIVAPQAEVFIRAYIETVEAGVLG